MSFILNEIRNRVESNIAVEVLPAKYDQYPIVVTDTNEKSATYGWSLEYKARNSEYGLRSDKDRFEQVTIKNADALISNIGAVCGDLRQEIANAPEGQTVDMKTYQPDDTFWYTATKVDKAKTPGVRVTVTVTDEQSPFHMLQSSFFIVDEENGQHPLVGYTTVYNSATNEWRDRRNSVLAPKKRPIIRTYTNGSNQMIAPDFSATQLDNGLVQVDQDNTKFDFVQTFGNDRRMLAGIYETAIMDVAFSQAKEKLPEKGASYSGGFGQTGGSAKDWATGDTTFKAVSQQKEQQQEQQQESQEEQEKQPAGTAFGSKGGAFNKPSTKKNF